MVKLTADLVASSAQFVNALGDREIDLRGNKIPVIENLGATLDQFDTYDLSDNEIRKIDGFPHLPRLKCILLNNNRILRIASNLEHHLPHLETLILTNNNLQELTDLDPLQTIKTLTTLCLLKNPVAANSSYRQYVISRLPQLRVLDFRKIKEKEREEAQKMFGDSHAASTSNTFEPGENLPARALDQAPAPAVPPPPNKDVQAIRAAIAQATSLDEMQRLEALLKSGGVPGKGTTQRSGRGQAEEEEDEDMDTNAHNGVS
ncbi:U2 small nuclear ribonucleoprotein A'-like [Sycon ciliatum]|uniref:U2 small nuclear ribonucleoprotein A'-like n=1 Tax=Sycon ciliatum TaxID=27933 RepID=UPI0031F6DC89|eukprot:scpid17826/ scgid23464/ U2 small nuclear ribonucleoprotein A&apos